MSGSWHHNCLSGRTWPWRSFSAAWAASHAAAGVGSVWRSVNHKKWLENVGWPNCQTALQILTVYTYIILYIIHNQHSYYASTNIYLNDWIMQWSHNFSDIQACTDLMWLWNDWLWITWVCDSRRIFAQVFNRNLCSSPFDRHWFVHKTSWLFAQLSRMQSWLRPAVGNTRVYVERQL